MKLRNKKTGEIIDIDLKSIKYPNTPQGIPEYKLHHSLAELNDEWEDYEECEDYEESKEYWFISVDGRVNSYYEEDEEPEDTKACKEIGNYFDTREAAEKAVEKLKAITRLNKCGFKFEGYTDRDRVNGGDITIHAHVDIPNDNLLEEAQPAMLKDLDLLFGGEE